MRHLEVIERPHRRPSFRRRIRARESFPTRCLRHQAEGLRKLHWRVFRSIRDEWMQWRAERFEKEIRPRLQPGYRRVACGS